MPSEPSLDKDSKQLSLAPESLSTRRPWWNLDRLGVLQSISGLFLGLIALLTSYDHLSFADHTIALPQQWGIPCIAASVATVFVDAELASRSRLRTAHEREAERYRAEQRENEADRERTRAAAARERQRKSLERLDQAALLSARIQLEPSTSNRERLRSFLDLMGQRVTEKESPAKEGQEES